MKKKTNTILTVRWSMDDLYDTFAEEGVPSTDDNVKKVLSEATLNQIRESAVRRGREILREQIRLLEPKGEEKEAGFREFCEGEWVYTWSGEGTWYSGNVHVDIEGEGSAEWKVSDIELLRSHLSDILSRNPYISADSIFEIISSEMDDILNDEYQEYAEDDDYYPPVGEDFEFGYIVKNFCKKNGFEVISYEFDGSTSDYEPN